MNSHANFSQPFSQTSHSSCKFGGRFCGWKAQFACPHGRMGWLAGYLMAVKNAGMNRFAVEMLDVQPEDQVLEIGFGHGHAVQMIAEHAVSGFTAGIDISDVMVRLGSKRNQQLVASGNVELGQASVANIPYEYARFNKVLAVNNYQFWPNAEHNLVEIQRVLGEDGLLVLCLRLKDTKKMFQLAPGYTLEEVEEIVGLVRWVGFRDVQVAARQAGSEAACVIARR